MKAIKILLPAAVVCGVGLPALAQSEPVLHVVNDRVGIGTDAPTSMVHVVEQDELPRILVEGTSGTNAALLTLKNNALPRFELWNTSASGNRWFFDSDNAGNLNFRADGGAPQAFRVFPDGDFLIAGQLTALGNGGGVFPDYVFDDDYELLPLADLRAFVEEKNHLPNVVSSAEVAAAGGINMTKLQLQLLEKVEELTLYVLQQQDQLQAQQEHIERLEARLTSADIVDGVLSRPFLW